MVAGEKPMRALVFIFAMLVTGFAITSCTRDDQPAASQIACGFESPAQVLFVSGDPHARGSQILQYWEFSEPEVLWSTQRPASASYDSFRTKLRDSGVETDPLALLGRSPWPNNPIVADFASEWIRPIGCLEMLLIGEQNARMDLLETPTEFASFVLRSPDRSRIRVFYYSRNEDGIGNVSPIESGMASSLGDAWTLDMVLHNHTFHLGQADVNGVTAPSGADAQMQLNLARSEGLREAWITNGVDTVRIGASEFGRFHQTDYPQGPPP
jgi:hypothetical protein